MKTLLFATLTAFIISVICGVIHIKIFRKNKTGQPILKYVESHKDKAGTPTMGGLFFIFASILTFTLFNGFKGKIASVSVSCGLAFLSVGLIDDFIKLKSNDNQGLRAYQKIIFQVLISLMLSVFMYRNGLTYFFIPFKKEVVDFGIFTIPFSAFIFIALTNSVNLTDGLDGLAGSTSVACIIVVMVLIVLEERFSTVFYLEKSESEKLMLLSSVLIGGLCGFLIFNVNKASVFMGDTGSLSIGGFLSCLYLFSFNGLFIPIIGIMFVMSSVSVIIQVISFKLRKKRVFLMTPLHHHFQLKGYTEAKIVFCYFLITCIMGIFSFIFYL